MSRATRVRSMSWEELEQEQVLIMLLLPRYDWSQITAESLWIFCLAPWTPADERPKLRRLLRLRREMCRRLYVERDHGRACVCVECEALRMQWVHHWRRPGR